MMKYISNYLCYLKIPTNVFNTTELYYYSGTFIKPANSNKPFDKLDTFSQEQIRNKVTELKTFGFDNVQNGYDFEKYYSIKTKNKIEIFEVNFNYFGLSLMDFIICLDEAKFNKEIFKLQNSAICVLLNQYFIRYNVKPKPKE